jgi:hypothetical protein
MDNEEFLDHFIERIDKQGSSGNICEDVRDEPSPWYRGSFCLYGSDIGPLDKAFLLPEDGI